MSEESQQQSLLALMCSSCGGGIIGEPGQIQAICPFCGSEQTESKALQDQIEFPKHYYAFVQSEEEADLSYRTFAKSKFWAPKEITSASLELQKLYLPAWIWQGRIESHYAGLISAMTRSGQRPISGSETHFLEQNLVPASQALRSNELNAIRPFEGDPVEFDPTTNHIPFEIAQLTREFAKSKAQDIMQQRHIDIIRSSRSISDLHVSSIYHDIEGSPFFLPIYIGVYRYKETPYRVLINGINGNLVGTSPISWLKVFVAILSVMLIILVIIGVSS